MRTADTAVLRKANPAVARKLTGFDLANRCLDQLTKFTALFLGDRCFQVLDLGLLFSHEYNECNIGYTADPGITNELRVQCQQTLRRSEEHTSELQSLRHLV